jgi:sulfate permease
MDVMILVSLTFLVSLFFALNIGASGAAASMGIAYSAGAVTKRMGVWVSALGLFLGAWFGGAIVMKTLSHGIVPSSDMSVQITLLVLIGATSTLFFANMLGIPLSTSEVTVGAIVGLGMVTHHVFGGKLLVVVAFWILLPSVSFCLAWGVTRFLKRLNRYEESQKWIIWLVVGLGLLEAVSAGMNNVANTMGPLVGSHLISVPHALLIGGLFLGIGSIILGKRTLETNGKQIVSLTLVEGGFVSGLVSILVILVSLLGIPIPMAQVTTCAIMGIGTGKEGFALYRKYMIRKILIIWLVSPVVSLVLSYGLIKIFVHADFYTLLIMLGVCLSTLGLHRLKSMNKEKASLPIAEEG